LTDCLCYDAVQIAAAGREPREMTERCGGRAERRRQLAGTLSGGEQQMLAIGRGIASAPRLLLLDEPSMGLAPAIADHIFDSIATLHREDKVTLILVEQRVAEALESCDYGYVLETGRVVLEGTHGELMADDRVRQAYLGM
jgi:branched-chain amino acid transport system ATP-binding protein